MPEETTETTEATPETESSQDPNASTEEFDKERALSTIRTQRESENAAKQRAKELEAELQQFRDRDLSEQEKAANKTADAEQRAVLAERTALRLDVALDKAPEGMPIAQVRKLAKRLTGETREEFEADAEELFAEFVVKDEEPGNAPNRRPQERLKAGAVPSAPADEDVEPGLQRLTRAYAQQ